MKKRYIPIEAEITEFDTEDVIVTSRHVFEYGDEDDIEESSNEDYWCVWIEMMYNWKNEMIPSELTQKKCVNFFGGIIFCLLKIYDGQSQYIVL